MRLACIVNLLALSMMTQAGHAASAPVGAGTLPAEVALSGPLLRLGDLLSEATRAALSIATVRQADSLVIARLGMNAQPFEISGRTLADTLRRSAPDLSRQLPALAKRDRVRIIPAMQPAPAEPLLAQVRNAWLDRCAASGGVRCTAVARQDTDTAITVPHGQISYSVALPARLLDSPPAASVPTTVRVDGMVVGTLAVRVDWHAELPAWRMRQPVERRAALATADVERVLVPAAQIDRTATKLDPRSGLLRATADLSAGTLIPASDSALFAAVRAGDEVPVRIAIGHVGASRRATALQDGRAGRPVFVRFDERDIAVAAVPARLPSAAMFPNGQPQ